MKLGEKLNAMSKRRHDGFLVHQNPDGSCVFVEGRRQSQRWQFFDKGELAALNACCARRGIKLSFGNMPWEQA